MVSLTADDVAELKSQASLCTKVLSVFRQGVLVVDEVDLVMHPLKVCQSLSVVV